MSRPLAHYREFAPCDALREHVRAFFSFGVPSAADPRRPQTMEVRFHAGDPFCSPVFADGHVSLVVSFPNAFRSDGHWHPSLAAPRADLIGAMNRVGSSSSGERQEMVGVYFRAGQIPSFAHVPACELTDRVTPLEELWGPAGARLLAELTDLHGESARVDRLESALLRRMLPWPSIALDVPRLASSVLFGRGPFTVEGLAEAAGVSRQHLARVFRDRVGVTPKTYCRLARFQAGLVFAGRGTPVDWARAALDTGYSDQSHMIAEFREFSSLTPDMLVRRRWFHPFIERTRAQRPAS